MRFPPPDESPQLRQVEYRISWTIVISRCVDETKGVEQRLLSDMNGAVVRSSWRTFSWDLTRQEASARTVAAIVPSQQVPSPLLQALMSTSAARSAGRELVLEEMSSSSRVLG
jgi:hypothetical protein